MDTTTATIEKKIQSRFKTLPKSVQSAITDANVEKNLRELASKHKLHLDQWVLLENEIMLALLGIEDPKDMAKNIAHEVHIEIDVAQALVNDIAVQVFQPIHTLLQQELSQERVFEDKKDSVSSTTVVYKKGERSSERRNVQEDPYRENI